MNSQELWQVEVNGQIYEAQFEELTQWISEGALLPQDKVRRGNLRWIQAGKVPVLHGFFNAKELGIAPPIVTTLTDNREKNEAENAPAENIVQTENFAPSPSNFAAPVTENFVPSQDFCVIHSDVESLFICDGCNSAFCKSCPKSFGGTVKICPMCGAMCKPIAAVRVVQEQNFRRQNDLSEGFGFGDFSKAFSYPFRYKTSLIIGGLMYAFFTVGQSATAIGGVFMIAGAVFCMMLANALTFGVTANTVENMSQGKLDRDFMPDFADFNAWDDVVHPFFLSIGAYLVSFGLLIAIVLGGVWYAFSSLKSSILTDSTAMTQPAQSNLDTVKQAEQFKESIEKIEAGRGANGREVYEEDVYNNPNAPLPDLHENSDEAVGIQEKIDAERAVRYRADTEESVREAQKFIEEQQKRQLETTFGKSPEDKQNEMRQLFSTLLAAAVPFVLCAGAALLWGLFYFPAACAVAGYTRSFSAVINPLVGLDTIRRMGADYFKLLLMGFLLMIIGGTVGGALSAILAPFNMPRFGNIPAVALGAFFGFYLSAVFSVTLGFALYKNSAKLNLYR